MTPHQLTTFLAVVDLGSSRAAALELLVTESAVSAALAGLQRDLGIVLLERSGRGLRVTPAGQVFAGYARRILGLMDEAEGALRHGADAEHGRLRLGAVATAGEYLLPGLLTSFTRRFPGVEVTLDVSVRDVVFARLGDHQLDVVIAGRPPAGSGLVTRATRPNSLVVVAGAGPRPVLEQVTWLLREPGSGTRDSTVAVLRSLEIEPRTLTLGSHGAVIASAIAGLGVTVASGDAVAHHIAAGQLQRLPVRGTPLDRPWHAVTSPAPTATTWLFVGHLTSRAHSGDLGFSPRRG
jgi:DNA-binding transcriptional LysR family regulator